MDDATAPEPGEGAGAARRRAGVFDRLIDLAMDLSGLLIWALAAGIFVNVILRRTGLAELSWLFEITEYALLLIAFLGGAALLRDRGHVGVDLVGEVVLPRAKRLVIRIGDALTAVIVIVMTAVSGLATYRNAGTGQVTPGVVEIPRWWIYAIIPVGFGLLSIQALRMLLRPETAEDARDDLADDPAERYPV